METRASKVDIEEMAVMTGEDSENNISRVDSMNKRVNMIKEKK